MDSYISFEEGANLEVICYSKACVLISNLQRINRVGKFSLTFCQFNTILLCEDMFWLPWFENVIPSTILVQERAR